MKHVLAVVCLALSLTACSSGGKIETNPTDDPSINAPTDVPDESATPPLTDPPTEGEPPTDVLTLLEPMRKTMLSLKSVHVKTVVEKTVTDLTVNSEQECLVNVTGRGVGGGVLDLRVVKGSGYVRGDERFWAHESRSKTEGARIVSLLKNRWVKVKPESLGSYAAACSLEVLFSPLKQEPFDTGDLQVGLVSEFKNLSPATPTTVFETSDKTVAVAVGLTEPHYLLALDRGKLGRMDFSKFNERFDIKRPARTVPLSLLQVKS